MSLAKNVKIQGSDVVEVMKPIPVILSEAKNLSFRCRDPSLRSG